MKDFVVMLTYTILHVQCSIKTASRQGSHSKKADCRRETSRLEDDTRCDVIDSGASLREEASQQPRGVLLAFLLDFTEKCNCAGGSLPGRSPGKSSNQP
jgi:hypothetical protein